MSFAPRQLSPALQAALWLLNHGESRRSAFTALRRFAGWMPRDPRWARAVGPLLPPGPLRWALITYGRPLQVATALGFAGGVGALQRLSERRRLIRG